MESEEAESIYSGLRYNSDFYLTSRTNAAEDGSPWIAATGADKNDRAGRREAIDSVLSERIGERASARDPVFTTCERDKTIPYVAILKSFARSKWHFTCRH